MSHYVLGSGGRTRSMIEATIAVAGEALSAGNLVSLYDDNGVLKARKANAATPYEAIGYINDSVAIAEEVTVWHEGIILDLSGLTVGAMYFLSNTPGVASLVPGDNIRAIGYANTATSIVFEPLYQKINGAQITDPVITGGTATLDYVEATSVGGDIASAAALAAHLADQDNPHSVTKAQVGLGNVEDVALSTWTGAASIITIAALAVTTHQAAIQITESQITDLQNYSLVGHAHSTSEISEGSNQYFTNERVDDRVSALLQPGTGITWVYDDNSGVLTPTISLSPFTTGNLTEGANLYYTDERVDDRVSALIKAGTGISWVYDDVTNALTPTISLTPFTTANLAESGNLYYTQARFDSAFAAKTTTNLTEGANLYFTNERVDDRVAQFLQAGTGITWSYNDAGNTLTPTITLSPFSTSNLAEGSNLYYTQARFDAALAAKSTSNVAEGTNLYFTNERVDDRVAALLQNSASLSFAYDDTNGLLTPTVSLAPFSTTNLAEGSNQYFTNARARAAISVSGDLGYNAGTGVLSFSETYSTPAELLAGLITVDGSLSGLDADLLDGQQGAYYLAWGSLTGVPSTFPATAHTHPSNEITDFSEAVDDRVAALFQNGTGISFAYSDGGNTLTPTVSLSPFSTSNLAEGANLYYTQARFDSALAAKSTTHLSEGSNLYFTDERVDDRVATFLQSGTGITWAYDDVANTLTPSVSLAAFSTTNLAEGSNLYWTQARFDAALAGKSTSNLAEGTNLYFTNERAQDAIASLIQNGTGISWSYNDASNLLTPTISLAPFSTSNLVEGSNLYWTSARFNSQFATKSTTDLVEGTNLYYTEARFTASLATKSTSNLVEGTNQYFTNARVDSRITSTWRGLANGLASLDATGKIPSSQLPSIAISETSVVASQAAQIALVAQEGDIAVRTDENKSYVHNGGSAGTMADWTLLLTPTDAIQSVNGQTGTVTLTTSHIAEGSNLYYTQARFDSAFSAKSTSNLAEGTNQYFTNARADARIAAASLGVLSDVTITAIASGEVLGWSGTAWINKTLAEAGISAVGHTHAASDIVSGTLDNARISQSSVTQHQASLSITESQISDLQSYALAGHTHVAANITDFNSAVEARFNTTQVATGNWTFTTSIKLHTNGLNWIDYYRWKMNTSLAAGITNDGTGSFNVQMNGGGLFQYNGVQVATILTKWDAGDVISGTFSNTRISQSSVTQHQAALVITESQISDLGSYSTVGHAHVAANITDFNTAVDARFGVTQTVAGAFTFSAAAYFDGTLRLQNETITPSGIAGYTTLHAESTGVYMRSGTGSLYKLLTVADEGAGNGIDADTLDGQHGSYYQNAGNLNAGTLPNARVSASNVTQHQASLSITESQISNLQSYALTSHNHTLDALSNTTITSNTAGEILRWNGTAWVNATLGEAGISATGHGHSAADVTSGTLADARIAQTSVTQYQASLTIGWGQLSGIPSTFAPSAHDLNFHSDVTISTPAAGDVLRHNGTAWVDVAESSLAVAWSSVTGKPSTFTPSAHTHPSTDITNFDEAVDDRIAALLQNGANVTWVYDDVNNTLTANVSGLGTGDALLGDDETVSGRWKFEQGLLLKQIVGASPTGVAGYNLFWAEDSGGVYFRAGTGAVERVATTAEVWDAAAITTGTFADARIPSLATSKITSGTFDNARISQSSVTQHQTALTITASQVSDFNAAVDARIDAGQGANALWTFYSGIDVGGNARFNTSGVMLQFETSVTGLAGYTSLYADATGNLQFKIGTAAAINVATVNTTWAASAITSGTLADARISQSSVTQYNSVIAPTWTNVSGKPSTFTPSAHTLDSHSNVTISSNTSGEILKWSGSAWINNTLAEAGIAAATHTHSASDLASGTLANARVAASNVTQHQAALTISSSQISDKGAAGGVASLDGSGKIPTAQMPSLALTEVFPVVSQAAQLALTAQAGDFAIRSDENKTYVHNGGTAGTMADWTLIATPTDAVLSVAGKTGVVVLDAGDIASGTFANARISSASVTQHQAALSIAWSQLTSVPSTFAPSAHTLDSHSNVTITSNTSGEILKWNGSAWINNTLAEAGISAVGHGHTSSDISDFNTAVEAWLDGARTINNSWTFTGTVVADYFNDSGASASTLFAIAVKRSSNTNTVPDIFGYTGSEGVVIGYNSTGTELKVLNGYVNVNGYLQVGGAERISAAGVIKNVNLNESNNNNVSAGVLNSGTLADARVAASNVTQHQAALTISTSQITALTAAIDARFGVAQTVAGAFNFTGGLTHSSVMGRTYGDPRTMAWGYSGGNYGSVNYGAKYTGTSGSHTFGVADWATLMTFYRGISIQTSTAVGTVNAAITWQSTFRAQHIDDSPFFKDQVVWHAGNDGAGSTLDADLLDGQQGSYYLAWANLTGVPSTFTPSSHTHPASDVISGTFDNARISQASVTQHQAALSITESQISNLQSYALTSHNHTLDALSNTTITSNTSGEILVWNGSAWINQTLAEAGISATSHTHTSFSSTVTFSSGISITGGSLNMNNVNILNVNHMTFSDSGPNEGLTWEGWRVYDSPNDMATNTTGNLQFVDVAAGARMFTMEDTAYGANFEIVSGGLKTAGTVRITNGGTLQNVSMSATLLTGSIADARVPSSNVTQHQGSLSIGWGQLTGVPGSFTPASHTLDSHSNVTITSNTSGEILKWSGSAWINNTLAEAGISAVGHTHVAANITDFASAVAATASVTANTAKVSNATHTGDVTGSTALTIAANAVTLAKMATMATASFLGRNTAGTGIPEVLSVATVKTMLSLNNVENTAVSTWAGSANITTLGTIASGSIPWARLTSVPSTFTPSAHNHAASEIASGTLADARLAVTNVTQFNSSIAPTWANVSGKPATASQAEAEAGTGTAERMFTPERIAQAIAALGGGGGLDYYALTSDDDITPYSMSASLGAMWGQMSSSTIYSMVFSDDGLKCFTICYESSVPKLRGYTLSVPFDYGSRDTGTSVNLNNNSESGAPYHLVVKSNGTKVYWSNTSGNIYNYSLSTGWDTSTLSYVGTFAAGANQYGWDISSDGLTYCAPLGGNVDKRTLGTAWTISTLGSATNTAWSGVASYALGIVSSTEVYVHASNNKLVKLALGSAWSFASPTVTSSTNTFPYYYWDGPLNLTSGGRVSFFRKNSNGNVFIFKIASDAAVAQTANFNNGTLQQVENQSGITWTFSNPPSAGTVGDLYLRIKNSGAYSMTFPSSVKWATGTQPLASRSGYTIYRFVTTDGGTTYDGSILNQPTEHSNSSIVYNEPVVYELDGSVGYVEIPYHQNGIRYHIEYNARRVSSTSYAFGVSFFNGSTHLSPSGTWYSSYVAQESQVLYGSSSSWASYSNVIPFGYYTTSAEYTFTGEAWLEDNGSNVVMFENATCFDANNATVYATFNKNSGVRPTTADTIRIWTTGMIGTLKISLRK